MPSLSEAYERRLRDGQIREDAAQGQALQALARLETDLDEAPKPSFFRRPEPIKGVYLWGPVGRGKSMLMDLFFETATIEPRLRVHFQAFMAQTHKRLNTWRKDEPGARK